jgi:hypothetical protein
MNTKHKIENKTVWERNKFSKHQLLYKKFSATGMRPPLWSSGQSSWLQIRTPGFDSRHYQKKGKKM